MQIQFQDKFSVPPPNLILAFKPPPDRDDRGLSQDLLPTVGERQAPLLAQKDAGVS